MAKRDEHGYIIREKYTPEKHQANLGDALAETTRFSIMSFGYIHPDDMIGYRVEHSEDGGYPRHPESTASPKTTPNDQIIPHFLLFHLVGILFFDSYYWDNVKRRFHFFVPGTKIIAQPALVFLEMKMFRMLALVNRVQGWLLSLPFRWSDDDSEGHGFRSSKNKVQDYLNMIAIWKFLRLIGMNPTLPRPARECYWAVWRYYARGNDIEPNSKWIRRAYFNSLKEAYLEERS